ncbi:zinc-ribbon domain-containing protein [Bacillus pseudomycoides]|uniref:zinc-ribbon domain-containing protein n=1 Tax=Bacillus pseudomycoides TaxID=64104 RepID=UPI000BED5D93|nr:zinc-ribbon domain-containing protein [Bacillus pseudomycoides]PEE35651.1 hypothetical protein COO02_27060 [Bacillus pseudomycoides]PEI82463.1 hypothetical protein CN679_27880 [Bacillus pseudomycoides]PGA89024.1 hypothetical protein COL91_19000 [Bacillus pseudomycoides]PHF35298.1 hypothetical protein COF72_26220 [Bacillus pseudomycoides]
MDNSLAKRNPELAKQWHETKNGKLTPFDVTYGSIELPPLNDHTVCLKWEIPANTDCIHQLS